MRYLQGGSMLKEQDKVRFKKILEDERQKIVDASQRTLKDDVQGQREADEVDQASTALNQNLIFRFRDRDRKLLSKIEQAMLAIDDGSYGECEECGNEISLKRLEARPVSSLCIECKEKEERSQKAFADKNA